MATLEYANLMVMLQYANAPTTLPQGNGQP